MNENKINWSFWLALVAFAISIVALMVFIIKVEPYSIVTIDTYIGVIATFIGLSVTLLVGYQIYNAIDLRQRVNAVERLKESLEHQKEQMEVLRLEQEERFQILQARLLYRTTGMDVDAFIRLHIALKYSLSIDHKKDGYKWLLDELELYMLNVKPSSFIGCCNSIQFKEKVDQLKEIYKADELEIRKHQNYLYIKDRYEELMEQFDKRLSIIARADIPSNEKLDEKLDEEYVFTQ